MSSQGWIKLHRQLQECPMWYEERFSKGQAWVDLLLLANHSDKKILFNGDFIVVKRGQYLTSMVKLAEKWKWDRKTVSKYLKLLEKDKMITLQVDKQKTLITIDNYRVYQETEDDTLDNGMDIRTDIHMDNGMDNGMDINKNDKECIKNDKNEKKSSVRENTRTIFERLIPEYSFSEALISKMREWVKYKTERKEPYKEQGMKSLLKHVQNNASLYGDQDVCELIDYCMASNWKGIIFDILKEKKLDTRKEVNPLRIEKKSSAEKYVGNFTQREYSSADIDDLEKRLLGVKT